MTEPTAFDRASAAYKECQEMAKNLARNDVASEREKILDALLCRLSDYSFLRYRAGQNSAWDEVIEANRDIHEA